MKNVIDEMEHYYVECQCDDVSHLVRIVLDREIFNEDPPFDEKDSGIYIETQLSCYIPLWKKIWYAFKYIFDMDTKYGHWDCTLLKMEDVIKIDEMFRRVIKIKEIRNYTYSQKNNTNAEKIENTNERVEQDENVRCL